MNLPQIHCSTTAQSNEQYKPLDLSTKPEFICESPPQKRNRYWFHPIEPLDLSVKEHNEEKSFSENDEIASNGTESSPFIISVMYQQKLSSIFEIRKSFSEGDNMKITKCSKKSKAGEIEQHDSFLKNEFVNYEKYTKKEKGVDEEDIASQLNLTPTINYQDDSNETQLEYITAGFSIKDNEHIIDSNTSIHTIEKYNKSDQLKIQSKNSVKNLFAASPMVDEAQQQPVKPSENGENTIYEQLETKFQTNIFQPIQNCEDQDSLPPPGKSRFECFDQPYLRVTRKPKVEELKKSGESFIQDGKCFEVAPKLPRCRECSVALQESLGKTQLGSENVLCRFYAFRKLRYSSKGFLATAGFLDPHTDPSEEDLSLWQPASELPHQDLDVHMAQYLLTHVGDKFCDLCKQEEEAVSINMSEDKKAAWKRPVLGCREMCDVCNTTLFNYHWTCRTCGFAVCIDCYKARKGYMPEGFTVERPWLICVNKRAHDQEKMMLTQIIPAESLKNLEQKAHHIRTLLGLPLRCCGFSSTPQNIPYQRKGFFKEFSAEELKRESEMFEEKGVKIGNTETLYNADSNISNMFNSSSNLTNLSFEDYFSDKDKNRAKLFKDLGTRLSKHLDTTAPRHDLLDSFSGDVIPKDFVEEILSAVSQAAVDSANARLGCTEASIPTRVMTLTESRVLYPNCPHSWLCEGRLLKLSDPSHAGNYPLFQDQWKRGQPVLVSGVLKFLDKRLWEPDSFIQDFGNTKNDLVNCMTGRVIPGQYMCMFWEGFQEMSKMLRDEKGNPMLLKLKDWPPGEDFAEMLPSRFEDLMKALPMGEYTKRTGQLNLPSRLPSSFARPDLGPKMYIAYGSAIHPTKGTTNLHLDISDAVNVMVYVGVPKDIDRDQFINEAYRAVDEACFEVLMRQRVRETSEVPGALWHIYSSRDAGKIRHLLTRVARERRIKLGPHQDPIHDQNWYLDGDLQERLFREYHVRGYAIVQCLGDAVFIPAGAPHQVRNLLNCIKVAEDFVSPENVSHCLHLTQEFRKLSDLHSNHEDKLQIKNIIYHTVKDSVTVLSSHK